MRTPLTYYGGKQMMLNHILPIMPKHRIYCEPYFGGGAVFFAKQPSYLEVINDKNDRLIIFYEEMRDNFDELNHLVSTTLHSESMYQKAKQIFNANISGSRTEIAWAVWVVINMSFGGRTNGGWKWENGKSGSHSGVYIKLRGDEFKYLRNRLANVQISSRDAIEVIIKRNTPETYFYLDPPYPGTIQGHYSGFTMKDFHNLLEVLVEVDGNFTLSNFWSQTLKYYLIKNDWNVKKIVKQMKIANFHDKRFKEEILVSNFNHEEINLFSQANINMVL